jgi:hypothetical protein
MINRVSAKLNSIVIHNLGNQSIGTDIDFSKSILEDLDDVVKETFMKNCLDSFKEPIFYKFNIPALDESGNMVFSEVEDIFTGESTLYEASINISRHLYNKSTNSNIKQSFFALAHISDMLIEDELLEGVMMCKFEIQDSILTFKNEDEIWKMNQEFGYLPTKIDKICLVLNTNADEGFKILNIDKTNPGGDAKYWKEEFLNVALSGNEYTYTSDYIKLTSNFLKKRKPIDEILEKGEEVSVLSRSADYFKKNKQFEENDYKKVVFQDARLIDAFDHYKESWQEKTQRPLSHAFDLNELALSKQQKVFKSVIKLDKNFHIYVHGDRDKRGRIELRYRIR